MDIMFFVNKDHTKVNTFRALMSFGIIALICIFCMLFVDRTVLNIIYTEQPEKIRLLFEKITRLGKGDLWIIGSLCLAVLGFFIKHFTASPKTRNRLNSIRVYSLFILSSILFSGALLNIIKTIIGRMRPRYFITEGLYGFQPFNFDFGMNTFPSGHSQTIWAVMTALIILFPRYALIFVPFATLVAASRILVSAHFVSDVLMGSYMGFLLTFYVYTWFVRKGYISNKLKNEE